MTPAGMSGQSRPCKKLERRGRRGDMSQFEKQDSEKLGAKIHDFKLGTTVDIVLPPLHPQTIHLDQLIPENNV